MIGYNNAFMTIGVVMAVLLPFVLLFRHPRRYDARGYRR